jgi:ferredoxin
MCFVDAERKAARWQQQKCIGGKSCLAGVRARFASEENGDETPNATTNDKDRVRFSPDHNSS